MHSSSFFAIAALGGCLSEFKERNFAPEMTVLSPLEGEVHNVGDSIFFQVEVSDPTDLSTDLSVRWESDLDGLFLEASPDSLGGLSLVSSELSSGTHNLRVTTRDDEDLYAETSVQIFVNTPPYAPTVHLQPDSPTTETPLSLTVATQPDAEDDPQSAIVIWYQNGTRVAELDDAVEVPADFTKKGETWSVEVAMNDGKAVGEKATASLDIANTPPVIDLLSIDFEATVYNNSSLTCNPTASDVDADPIEFHHQWSILSNGMLSELSENEDTLVLIPTLAGPGDRVYCTATAQDGIDSDASSTYVEVENRAPIVAEVIIFPGTGVRAGTNLSCNAVTNDLDQDSVSVDYRWLNGTAVIAVTPNFVLSTDNGDKGDVLTCQATVIDEHGSVVTGEASVEIANTPPVLNTVSITPPEPTGIDVLTCNAVAEDIDGDAINHAYLWEVDGVLQPETSATFGPANSGQTVVCSVTVSDDDVGNTMSESVSIGNSPPTVDLVQLTTDPVYTNDVLAAVASVNDDDGDSLLTTYDWYVDGDLVKSGFGSTLNGVDHFDKGQEVQVFVTTTDSIVSSTTVASNAITVANTPPEQPGVSFDGDHALADENLTCGVVQPSNDADGDPVAYTFTWQLNGVDWAGTPITTTLSDDTIDQALLNPGDVWRCSATASDQTAESTEGSAESTIISCPLQYEYDIVTDFANLDDLQGCWSTGFNSVPDSPSLSLFYGHTVRDDDGDGSEDMEWLGKNDWSSNHMATHPTGVMITPENASHGPITIKGATPTFQYILLHNPNVLKFHPGPDYIYLRWIAPIDADCDFNFGFAPMSYFTKPQLTRYVDTTVSLYQNQQWILEYDVHGFNDMVASMNETITVQAGDTIDFVLPPTPGSTHLDWVQMTGTISCPY
jgi:hypothetical protein